MSIQIQTSRKVAGSIRSIRDRGRKLDGLIHETGIQCMLHAREHGDVTLATRLVDAMPRSGRRKALIRWFTDHTPMKYSEKKQAFGLKKKAGDDDFQIEAANATPFWDYSKEPRPVTIDPERLITNLVNRVKKGVEQGTIENQKELAEKARRAIIEA